MPFWTASRGFAVDPREQLKRYLEQRRELGESELVLDSMTVDEVLSIVSRAVPGSRPPRKVRAQADDPVSAQPSGPVDLPVDARDGQEENVAASESIDPAEEPGDWRAALRASGAAPEVKKSTPRPAETTPPPVGPAPKPSSEGATSKPPPTSKKYEFPAAADLAAAAPSDAVSARERQTLTPVADTPSAVSAGGAAQPSARIPGVDAPLGLVVGDPSRDLFGTSVGKLGSLKEIAEVVAECTRCPLYSTATNPVPGEGSPNAELVCVGEAPGANEDATGRPFVGQSGELLTKILAAISLRREDVFICNVLKHRPPGNRNPLPEEVVACSPYLVQQLELIRPKVIVAFGTFAAQTLLNTKLPIGKLRGSVHRYHGVPLIVTYHPAALLRNPAWKRPTWEDVQLARRILDNAPRA